MKRWCRTLHRNLQREYETLGRDCNKYLFIQSIRLICILLFPHGLYSNTHPLVEILIVAFTETEREYEALVTSPSQKPARGV